MKQVVRKSRHSKAIMKLLLRKNAKSRILPVTLYMSFLIFNYTNEIFIITLLHPCDLVHELIQFVCTERGKSEI